MKILLIDNEAGVRSVLKEFIHQIHPAAHQIKEADGVHTGLQAVRSFQPDVLFLDIEMDDGTGFDLLKRIESPAFQLIFTTAFNQYAVEAFKFSAIDYLLKPIDIEEVRNSLERASRAVSQRDLERQLEILQQQLSARSVRDRQIVLKDVNTTYFIKVNDILYCMADGAYTQFFLVQADPILVSRNLSTHEELLAPSGFIRTHHSFLVNPLHIKRYDRASDSLVLTGGHSVSVAQRKREMVIQMLESR